MKINSTFHISVFLMAVLIFSVPFITFAQQNTGNVLAITEAKRDAKKDVNELGWFAAGCLGGALPIPSSTISEQKLLDGNIYMIFACGAACFPTFYALFNTPTPPPDRLLGKSPAYVLSYVNTYVSEVKRRRILSSGAGCCVGYTTVFLIAASQGWIDVSFLNLEQPW